MRRRAVTRCTGSSFAVPAERLPSIAVKLSLAVLLFFTGVSLTLWWKRSPPKAHTSPASEAARVVTAYWGLAANGQVHESGKFMTNSAEGIGRVEPPDTTQATLIHLQKLKTLKIENETSEGEKAKVTVAATSTLHGGFTRRYELTLLRRNGEWRIFSVSNLDD
jgi:hypothetical protein